MRILSDYEKNLEFWGARRVEAVKALEIAEHRLEVKQPPEQGQLFVMEAVGKVIPFVRKLVPQDICA